MAIKDRRHYEITFGTEDEALEEEYQLSDGCGPFIDTEVDGKKLIFADCEYFRKVYADIVAKNWWNGRAVLVEK